MGCPSCFNIPTTPLKKNLNRSCVGGSARIFGHLVQGPLIILLWVALFFLKTSSFIAILVSCQTMIQASWTTLLATTHSCCCQVGDYSSFFSGELASYILGCPSCFNIWPLTSWDVHLVSTYHPPPWKKNLNRSCVGGARAFSVTLFRGP